MIRVGPAGWSYADWEGPVYPVPKPRGFQPLAFLARFVDLVEINTSFYGLPSAESARRWVELIAPFPEFRCTAKLHQRFTHSEEDLERLEPEARAYEAGLEPLRAAGRLAAVLAQFPLSFGFAPAAVRRVAELRARFARVPLVVELRHRSWFEAHSLRELSTLDVSLAAIDLPASPRHPPDEHATPGPIGYLRLHGRNSGAWFARDTGRDAKYDYLYSPAEIAALASRARRVAGEHDETYVVTNNHFEGKAVANAIELIATLTGAPVGAPRALVQRYPQLAGVARPEGQAELF